MYGEPRESRGTGPSQFGNDKGDLHVPGAGTFGMALLLASLGVLFTASLVGFLFIRFVRFADQPWPPPGFPPLPRTLWASTVVILLTSVSIQWALGAIRRGDLAALRKGLLVTLVLGLLFLALQQYNWWEIWTALTPAQRGGGPDTLPAAPNSGDPYIKLFFALTGLHAAHVIGGLIPLAVVTRRATAGGPARYSANYHPGVRDLRHVLALSRRGLGGPFHHHLPALKPRSILRTQNSPPSHRGTNGISPG